MREPLKAAALFVGRLVTFRDFVCIAGLGCLWYGLSLVYVPAAWVAIGAALFWMAVRGKGAAE